MHRFYIANANFTQKTLTITDKNEIHHMKDVLRLQKGAEVGVFNSQNQEATVMVEAFTSQGLVVKIQSVKEVAAKAGRIVLACAPPKKDKFEWIIEKCTELGVDEIIPLRTARSEVVFSDERMSSKMVRFEKVVVNAAKQSKRIAMPKIHPMKDLAQVLKELDPKGVHLFPSLHGHPVSIKDALSKAKADTVVTIFIGPEGDFTPSELQEAIKSGVMPITLGNTVLKVETAAIATVSFVRFWLGN